MAKRNKDWLDTLAETPEDERLYQEEYLILDASERILQAMEEAGLTQADVAKQLDCSPGHISQLLNGERNMTLRSLADLAWATGCRVEVRLQPGEQPAAEEVLQPARAAQVRQPGFKVLRLREEADRGLPPVEISKGPFRIATRPFTRHSTQQYPAASSPSSLDEVAAKIESEESGGSAPVTGLRDLDLHG